jgi:hypothetical protein
LQRCASQANQNQEAGVSADLWSDHSSRKSV